MPFVQNDLLITITIIIQYNMHWIIILISHNNVRQLIGGWGEEGVQIGYYKKNA